MERNLKGRNKNFLKKNISSKISFVSLLRGKSCLFLDYGDLVYMNASAKYLCKIDAVHHASLRST